MNPAEKRLAAMVEDHPLDYGDFEGIIPQGHYGTGPVLIWDSGEFRPEEDPETGLRNGKLSFTLGGEKLKGAFSLALDPLRFGDGRVRFICNYLEDRCCHTVVPGLPLSMRIILFTPSSVIQLVATQWCGRYLRVPGQLHLPGRGLLFSPAFSHLLHV